jgi:hypothetical protein
MKHVSTDDLIRAAPTMTDTELRAALALHGNDATKFVILSTEQRERERLRDRGQPGDQARQKAAGRR